MNIKICGITTIQDALIAVNEGAWALGFNFYQYSPRYISKEKAKNIIEKLPKSVIKVGIFLDKKTDEILAIIDEIGLDFAQIYQEDKIESKSKSKMILALQPTSETRFSNRVLSQYAYILIDAPQKYSGLYGGTGHIAEWNIAKMLAKDHRLILAGGLNPQNIQEAIERVNPFAVDVASGLEYSPGIKDPILIKQFIAKAQYAH